MALTVSILTPHTCVLTTPAEAVGLTTAAGHIEVLPGHVALMGELQPGTVRIRVDAHSPERAYETGLGGFEVSGDRLVIMCASAQLRAP